jgi:hypothetical protein
VQTHRASSVRVADESRLNLSHDTSEADDVDASGAGFPQGERRGVRGGAARVHVVHEADVLRRAADGLEGTADVAPPLDDGQPSLPAR